MRTAILALAVSFCLAGDARAATITVTGNGDAIAIDGQCTLREALTAANTNVAVNECAAGTVGLDTIAFNIGIATINIGAVPLPVVVEAVAIDGGGAITIDGGNLAANGFELVANDNSVRGLTITHFSSDGIVARSSGNSIIGNTISDNRGAGIHLISATDSIIQNNTISRPSVFATGGEAVLLESSSGNTIGAFAAGTNGNDLTGGRLSAGAVAPAVRVVSGVNNAIRANIIHRQNTPTPDPNGVYADYPIDLGNPGPTPNDACDADSGANMLQNAPVILSAVQIGSQTVINGFLNSAPLSSYTIEFFEHPRYFNGFSGVTTYPGHVAVTTNSSCTASFRATFPASSFVYSNAFSATATDAAGNTSEMTTVDGAFNFDLQKAFAPATIITGGSSHLTLMLTGPSQGSSASFTDALPAGLIASNVTTTCSSTTATTNGSSISVSAHLPPLSFAPCKVEADVAAAAPGVYTNTIPSGALTGGALNGDPFFYPVTNGDPAVATLTVVAPNTVVTKSFAAPVTNIGTIDRLTITITNPNPAAVMTSVAFTDAYPANLVNASPANASSTCGGTLTAANGGTSIALSGGTIAAGAACTVSVDLVANASGNYTNTIAAGGVTSSGGSNVAPATASVIVRLNAPAVAKSFAKAQVAAGESDRLTITLTNPNASAITGVAFTDTYPANLTNATPVNAVSSCGGTVTANAGAGSLALSGGTIPASGVCTIAVDLIATAPGGYTNTLPIGSVTSANAQPSGGAASASVTAVTPAPAMSSLALLLLGAVLAVLAIMRMH